MDQLLQVYVAAAVIANLDTHTRVRERERERERVENAYPGQDPDELQEHCLNKMNKMKKNRLLALKCVRTWDQIVIWKGYFVRRIGICAFCRALQFSRPIRLPSFSFAGSAMHKTNRRGKRGREGRVFKRDDRGPREGGKKRRR